MNLGETRISKKGTTAMSSPYGGTVTRFGVSREVENVGIPSRCEHNHVGSVTVCLTSYQVARHYAARSAIDNDYVKQFTPEMHRDASGGYLLFEGLVSTE